MKEPKDQPYQTVLSKSEAQIVDLLRTSPPYAEFEIVKKPTKRNPMGDIVRVSVKSSQFFELSTAPEMTGVV